MSRFVQVQQGGGAKVFGQIDLKPGRYQPRIAANSPASPTAGSVCFDIDVPDFANEPLTMSGLLLTSTPNPQFAPKNALKPTVPIVRRRAGGSFRRLPPRCSDGSTRAARASPYGPRAATIRDDKDAIVIDRKQDLPATLFAATHATDLQIDLPMSGLTGGFLPGDH